MPISPSAFNQHMTDTPIPSLRDAAPPNRRAGRTFTGYKTKKAHELARILKSSNIAYLGGKSNRDDQIYGAETAMHERPELIHRAYSTIACRTNNFEPGPFGFRIIGH